MLVLIENNVRVSALIFTVTLFPNLSINISNGLRLCQLCNIG